MVYYFYSEEGQKEYDKIGLKYPKTNFDYNHDEFMRMTARSPREQNKIQILSITRIKPEDSNEEFLTYHIRETRYDSLGNERSFVRTNIGRYQIPVPRYGVKKDAQGYEEKKVVGVSNIRTGYSIEFNKKNLEKLHKNCKDSGRDKCRYSVHVEGERNKIRVESYEDFRDLSFKELYQGKKRDPAAAPIST